MQPKPLKNHREPHLQNLAYLLIYFPTIAAILIGTLTRYPYQTLHDPFLPYYDTVTSALTISTIAVTALATATKKQPLIIGTLLQIPFVQFITTLPIDISLPLRIAFAAIILVPLIPFFTPKLRSKSSSPADHPNTPTLQQETDVYYQKLIHELDPHINPAGVEANMRLQYGTLDHLSRDTFRQEIQIARASEAESPGYLKDTAESYGMDDEFTKWQETLDHQAQDASIPQQVLLQLHSQNIPHKLQSQRELHNPDNPHIAPGWNALKLAEMLTSAFFLAAAAQTDFVPGTAHYPWLPLPQVEQAAPGTTTALLTALQDHEISDQLTLALQTELQAIASKVITDMPENTVHTLMNTAKTRVQNMMDQNHAHN